MPKLPKEVSTFMERFNVTSDELWEVRSGAWAIKHKAIERVAAEQNIKFTPPLILSLDMHEKIAAIIVTGQMGERSEWSTGEAAPYNNKNTYPLAMAEKRAKDRVTLKLLSAHGALYSEDEADDFKQPERRENPHVTRPTDLSDAKARHDERGQRVDWIDTSQHRVERLSNAKARPVGEVLDKAMRMCGTPQELVEWGEQHAEQVASLPVAWEEIFQNRYQEFLDELRKGKAA